MNTGGAAEYWLTRWLIQRSLAALYLVAFVVALNQFRPLLGERGLLPTPLFLSRVSFWNAPGLFQLYYSDRAAAVLAWIGALLSLGAVSGLSEMYGTPVSAAVWALLWLLYISFVNVGQTFYSFGWESLLLETGFLAIFLGAPHTAPPTVVIWLMRWVLFRLMFGAGLIKIRGDSCWRDLTCLAYHYETQPIPNALSWYFYRLPMWIHKVGVLFNHFVELVVPFGYLTPIPMVRYAAGALTIVFQGMLILSGNLSWLNYLTIVLALACFDDALLSHILPLKAALVAPRSPVHDVTLVGLALGVAALSIRPVVNMLSEQQLMNASFEPFHLVNTYGAFGSVSRERDEVVIEGTSDSTIGPATQWREYQFRAKPGDPNRRPVLVSPYHLRLDWLMWFAALSPQYAEPWLPRLAAKLLAGDAATLSLLASNPFPGDPPRQVRARMYRYRYTTAEEHRRTGAWWSRALVAEYLPPLSLSDSAFVGALERQGWETPALPKR